MVAKTKFKKISSIKQLQMMADIVREDIITSLLHAKSGHSAGPLGMADIMTALYFNILKHNPKKPKDPKRDRFILSNGHTCPVLYSVMANAGYFPKKELLTLRKLGSRLQGHPHRRPEQRRYHTHRGAVERRFARGQHSGRGVLPGRDDHHHRRRRTYQQPSKDR